VRATLAASAPALRRIVREERPRRAACAALAAAGLAASALCAPGCAAWDAEAQARDSAREWLDCEEVELEPAAETAWHAQGCGRTVDVACSTSANSPHCIRVRIASRAGEEPGEAVRATGGEEPGAVSGRGEGRDPVAGADPGASPGRDTEPAASEGEPPPAAERSLRAALDARREDALACASRDRLVVSASWTPSGAVSLALSGDLAGSAEEGCVRAALEDLRVEGATAPGTILHLLRR